MILTTIHRYLYWLFVSLDACFQIKRYDVSDENKDPILDDGLAYFIKNGPYQTQIKKYKNQKPVSVQPLQAPKKKV